MDYVYTAELTSDPEAGLLVTFPDVPEAITFGTDKAEALESAAEALGLALRSYAARGLDIPRPGRHRGFPVAVPAEDALKIATITAFQVAGISKSELARRLGKTENEARRILDPDHATKARTLQAALRAMNRQVAISVVEAA